MKKNIIANSFAIALGIVEFKLLVDVVTSKGAISRGRTGGWVLLPIIGLILVVAGNYLHHHRVTGDFKNYLFLFIGWLLLVFVTPILLIIFYTI